MSQRQSLRRLTFLAGNRRGLRRAWCSICTRCAGRDHGRARAFGQQECSRRAPSARRAANRTRVAERYRACNTVSEQVQCMQRHTRVACVCAGGRGYGRPHPRATRHACLCRCARPRARRAAHTGAATGGTRRRRRCAGHAGRANRTFRGSRAGGVRAGSACHAHGNGRCMHSRRPCAGRTQLTSTRPSAGKRAGRASAACLRRCRADCR